MAHSRLEKIGTIFSRVNGLIKTGAMKWEDRPLWYDVYKAFPPKDEPRYDRPAPDTEVPSIFYEEDNIRAQFHKNNKNLGSINIFNNKTRTRTQRFIEIYKRLEASEAVEQEKLYDNAMEVLIEESEKLSEDRKKETTFVSSFKEAQEEKLQKTDKIDIKNLFKE